MPELRKSPPHMVARPDLCERLDSALTRPLTLVVAPAGSGKTVLLSQWVALHDELEVVWLDITPADADPAHFARKLLGALSAVRPSILELITLLRISDGALGAAMLDALAMELESLPSLVLVFDDLHLLSNPTLQAELGELVGRFPPTAHAIFSSRVDLPGASPRRRLDLDIPEFRAAELAFGPRESEQLIRSIVGHDLTPDEIEILVDRTEGWVAGLQLAGLSVRFHGSDTGFVEQLAGTNRLVVDYLTDEVLRAQSPRRRMALLRLSVLDQISAPLIALLTEYSNGQELLDELERDSMFIKALDPQREWFRFHHLFRDVLRYRLRAEDGAAESESLSAAAVWHLERGETSVAADYLIRAKDWLPLVDVILDRGSEVYEKGEMATVIGWIRALPPTLRSDRMPDVQLLLGLLLTLDGSATAADDILRGIAVDDSSRIGQRIVAMCFVAALVQFRSPVTVSAEFGERALELLEKYPDEPIPNLLGLTGRRLLATQALGSAGRAYFFNGDLTSARNLLERALNTDGSTYPVYRVHIFGTLALIEAWEGNLARAEQLANAALDVATEFSLLSHPSPADAYFALARVAIERGQSGKAALWQHEGAILAASNNRTQLMWLGHLIAAMASGSQPELFATAPHREMPPIVRDGLDALAAQLTTVREPAQPALLVPFTEREQEIFAHLPTRMSNSEIATRYFLSVNTVKTHIAHIYQKLGVTNRDAAIARAQELGLH